jgi:hypothetical protein
MGIGKIDPESAVREGWARDSDDEIYMDGYNATLQISTHDGTSGFSVKNDIGAVAFSSKSDGDGYVAKRLGVGTFFPATDLEVIGKTSTDQLQVTTDPTDGYVLTADSVGNATWQQAPGAAGGISATEHRALDQLVHLVAEDSFDNYTYISLHRISNITTWTNSSMTQKIREKQISYDGIVVSQITNIQYNSSGTEVERMVEDFTYEGFRVKRTSRVVTL